MTTTWRRLSTAVILFAASVGAAACYDYDPTGAAHLWRAIQPKGERDYRSWQRAPNYPYRMPSFTSHSDAVEIFVNPIIQDALENPSKVSGGEWPVGSVVVKEGYRGDTMKLVAAMEKRPDGWFYAEWDAEGDADFSGHPRICVDCHRENTKDHLWSFGFRQP